MQTGEEVMPDGSLGCQRILDQLEQIQANQQTMREMHIAHAASVSTEINLIKDKIDTIESNTDRISVAAARRDGMFDGAVWTMAKVGTFVTMLMAFVGWLTTGGGWAWIKEHI